MTANSVGRRTGTFIATKEHRRFTEFANVIRRHRTIGLCFGPAGVGKTLSARRYANWNLAEPLLQTWGERHPSDQKVYNALARSRALFHTPPVSGTLRELRNDLDRLTGRVNACIEQSKANDGERFASQTSMVELVIIDEAERLSTAAVEHLRDTFDRTNIGLMLIGMPGIEKRMARYPQLYSRVGFAHHYRPLRGDELTFVLTRHWRKLGLSIDCADFTDTQAIATISRITSGNFRLLHRLFIQIERILKINELTVITEDVIEAASSILVIGAT